MNKFTKSIDLDPWIDFSHSSRSAALILGGCDGNEDKQGNAAINAYNCNSVTLPSYLFVFTSKYSKLSAIWYWRWTNLLNQSMNRFFSPFKVGIDFGCYAMVLEINGEMQLLTLLFNILINESIVLTVQGRHWAHWFWVGNDGIGDRRGNYYQPRVWGMQIYHPRPHSLSGLSTKKKNFFVASLIYIEF